MERTAEHGALSVLAKNVKNAERLFQMNALFFYDSVLQRLMNCINSSGI
jgi:hypothetical protein